MDANSIEKKWITRWQEEKAFEANPKTKEKRYLTAAFPYPNSPQHIGHARTYTTTDIYARYLRHCGYNVLFPMAFHVTGTPILAMAKRIEKKDSAVLDVFENIYGIPKDVAESLTDPKDLVTYFSKEIEEGMREMGFSIDWRRKFYTYDPKFNKFIQWQFRKLKELGYLIKGTYPIAWCPSDGNALSAHDTKGDVDPELEEVTVLKFEIKDQPDTFFVVTTYRPETIYGVTNIWINPKHKYVKAKYSGETLILSQKAADLLKYQWKGLEVAGEVSPDELLGYKARNPIHSMDKESELPDEFVPVYEASFVKDDVGTGVVMSVPAHAPLDYLALRDMGKESIRMPQVIEAEGYGNNPAKEVVEKLGVKDQDDPKSEEATKLLYKTEAHQGKMIVKRFLDLRVIETKVKGGAFLSYIFKPVSGKSYALNVHVLANGPVFCRCGSHAVVNILNDQWFIDYGIPEWKEKAKSCLANMSCIPEKSRSEFDYTIDWLKTRPTTRSSGLGTKFPFDESKVIEALSDSTLYMSYYTIAHLLENFSEEDLNEEFFDYVFLGKGAGNSKLETLRKSFLYWYPVDSRHSAGDLVRNHLTLYIFNHVGVYEEKLWPRQIVTNGFVTMEGSKMSKSMGNILPLRKAIREYGADVIRFAVVCGADLATDSDFNKSVADGVKSRLSFISRLVEEAQEKEKSRIDRWILSKLNRKIKRAKELYENVAIRHLALEIFYDVTSDLQWYLKRTDSPNLLEFFRKWIILISPFMPHYAEEFWEKLGNEKFVSFAPYPECDESQIDDSVEMGEDLVKKVHEDIEKISSLIGKKPESVKIFIADSWKRKLYGIAREHKKFDVIMKEASAADLPMKDVGQIAKQLMRNVHSLPEILSSDDELSALQDAQKFLSAEFGCPVEVLPEDPDVPKAKNSIPGKPSILIM